MAYWLIRAVFLTIIYLKASLGHTYLVQKAGIAMN